MCKVYLKLWIKTSERKQWTNSRELPDKKFQALLQIKWITKNANVLVHTLTH